MTAPDLTRPVVIFTLAGRRPNMELQIPLMKRILADNPNTQWNIWNLARTDADRAWLPTIAGERIRVFNDLHWCDRFDGTGFGYAPVYGYYTQPEFRDHLFVKTDDDVVFYETGRFDAFLTAIDSNRDHIVSALVVNNGACTPLVPGLWQRFVQTGVPLLDVHTSNAYAVAAHNLFLSDPDGLIGQPAAWIPTLDWCSINCIGYDWTMACAISDRIGAPQPDRIADRDMREWGRRIGDEGVVNEYPRLVVQGFTVAHLGFAPQLITEAQARTWRTGYAALGARYLDQPARAWERPAGLAEPSYAYPLAVGDSNTAKHQQWRTKYQDGRWTRRRIIRSIAKGDRRVVTKLANTDQRGLTELFRWMMECRSERAALVFAQQWAACRTVAAERALILATWPGVDTDYGL